MHIELHDLSHSRVLRVSKHFVFSALILLGQLHETSRFFILANLSQPPCCAQFRGEGVVQRLDNLGDAFGQVYRQEIGLGGFVQTQSFTMNNGLELP